MAILQFWCPKHHTQRRWTSPEKVIFGDDAIMYADWRQKVGVVKYKTITPVCPVCRKKMIRLHGKMPKKSKK